MRQCYNKVLNFVVFCKLKVMSYFPTALPKGITEFETWSSNVIKLAGEIAKIDHMKFVLASQILHMDSKTSKVPMNNFVRLMHKAAANQVASAVFQDIKMRQEEEAKAAQQAATVAPETPESGQRPQGS